MWSIGTEDGAQQKLKGLQIWMYIILIILQRYYDAHRCSELNGYSFNYKEEIWGMSGKSLGTPVSVSLLFPHQMSWLAEIRFSNREEEMSRRRSVFEPPPNTHTHTHWAAEHESCSVLVCLYLHTRLSLSLASPPSCMHLSLSGPAPRPAVLWSNTSLMLLRGRSSPASCRASHHEFGNWIQRSG